MVWIIFHLLLIKLIFQLSIVSKFVIAISVVSGPFFDGTVAHCPTPSQSLVTAFCVVVVIVTIITYGMIDDIRLKWSYEILMYPQP